MTKNDVPNWVKDAIFYQIFPERFANGDKSNDPDNTVSWGTDPTRQNFFGGDLQGIIDHIPYLKDLGISAIYLNPIFKGRTNHKYDTCNYFKIDPRFGSKKTFRTLIEKAHQEDIKVILDAVFNHCGAGFWAFEDVKEKGPSSEYAPWFFINNHPIKKDPLNYQTAGCTWYLPKLNVEHPEVREHLLNVATYWIEEFEIDGWRLDIPWKVPYGFWVEFREEVKALNPNAYIVGEVWRDSIPWTRGDTCDGVMNYTLREYVLDYCVHQTMDAEDFDYEVANLRKNHGEWAPFQLNLLGSHDTPRFLTLCENDVKKAVVAWTFVFTYIGSPMIYYGDEIGLEGGNDPDCRRSMPWDETQWNKEIYNLYRKLISLRKKHPALRTGSFKTLKVFNGVYVYLRHQEDENIIVILNPRGAYNHIKIPLQNISSHKRTWKDLLNSDLSYPVEDGSIIIDKLPAKSALILYPK